MNLSFKRISLNRMMWMRLTIDVYRLCLMSLFELQLRVCCIFDTRNCTHNNTLHNTVVYNNIDSIVCCVFKEIINMHLKKTSEFVCCMLFVWCIGWLRCTPFNIKLLNMPVNWTNLFAVVGNLSNIISVSFYNNEITLSYLVMLLFSRFSNIRRRSRNSNLKNDFHFYFISWQKIKYNKFFNKSLQSFWHYFVLHSTH